MQKESSGAASQLQRARKEEKGKDKQHKLRKSETTEEHKRNEHTKEKKGHQTNKEPGLISHPMLKSCGCPAARNTSVSSDVDRHAHEGILAIHT